MAAREVRLTMGWEDGERVELRRHPPKLAHASYLLSEHWEA